MNGLEVIRRYKNALSNAIAKKQTHSGWLYENLKKGKITTEYSIELRGYFKGLEAAMKLLDKQIAVCEEIENDKKEKKQRGIRTQFRGVIE